MPQISFLKNRPPLIVNENENLMKALLDAGVPVASSCHGDGICSKCKIKIIDGAQNLSSETENEIFLREKNNIKDDFRISCQVAVLGDITIDATYW